jgi:hypothetical protein
LAGATIQIDIRAVQLALSTAVASGQPTKIHDALQFADSKQSVATHFEARDAIRAARTKLDALTRCQEEIRAAMLSTEILLIENASNACELTGYNGTDLSHLLERRDRVRDLVREATQAVDSLDSALMADVLARAAAMRVSLPSEPYMQKILALPARQRLQLQLRSALDNNNVEGVVSCTLDIKRLFFAEAPAAFDLATCPALISRLDFQRGLEELDVAEVVPWISYSASPLPKGMHLTKLSHPLNEAASALSHTILAFSGELYFQDILLLAAQLVHVGIMQSELRDEILVQLARHLTGNPNAVSAKRAAALLHLCVSCFAPSEVLENYLEAFVRRELSSTHPEYADAVLRALHRTAFVGSRSEPPSVEEVRSIMRF